MVILLTGPDTFRSQRRFLQLRDAFRAKHDTSGMSTSILDGQELTLDAVRNAVRTTGFFSAKRFVGLNNVPEKGAAILEEIVGVIEPYAEDNDVIAVLRLVPVSASATPRRGKKAAAPKTTKVSGAKIEEFPLLTGAQIQKWLIQEAKTRGGSIVQAAVAQLQLWDGDDLWKLSNDLEKLLALANGKAISVDDVEAIVKPPEVADIFGLTDALGQKQSAKALRLLRQELAAGTHPIGLIATLANHVRTLWLVQQASQQTVSAPAIASQLGLHPFVTQKALQQSRNFSRAALAHWHHQLLLIDEQLKSSALDAEALLSLVILQA